MSEEMIDVEVNLGKELAGKIKKMNKTQLTNDLIVSILRNRVQDETVRDLEGDIASLNRKHADELRRERRNYKDTCLKLDLAESYVAQAKAMIDAVMDRWDEYDV